jgi:hypothetical protein
MTSPRLVVGVALASVLTLVVSARGTSIGGVIEGTGRGDYPRILLDGGSLWQRADGGWAALFPVDAGVLRLYPIPGRPDGYYRPLADGGWSKIAFLPDGGELAIDGTKPPGY